MGPRGTIEYIPFSTNNFRILNIFTEFLPYMPCDDWYRKEDGIWRHIHYDNNPSKNTSPISIVFTRQMSMLWELLIHY